METSGYLGGRDRSWKERLPMIRRHLQHQPRACVPWSWSHQRGRVFPTQCRCGSIEFVRWRRRWNCPRCGRWFLDRQDRTGRRAR